MTVDNAWYVNYGDGSTTGYYAATKWASTTAKTVGNIVRQNATPTAGNERCFICIVAGTTLGSEPAWVLTYGAKTTESGGPTWMECTGRPGTNGDVTNTPLWAAVKSTIVALGQVIKNSTADHLFICTTSGAAGSGSEPSWNTTTGATTTDNAATWTCIGAVGAFSAWGAPFARMNAFAVSGFVTANGTPIYIGDNHNESSSANPAYQITGSLGSPTQLLSVDHTAAVPPAASALKAGATITETGGALNLIANTGGIYIYGVTLVTNFTSGGRILNIAGNNSNVYVRFDKCTIKCTNASALGDMRFGYNLGGNNTIEMNDCQFQFANTGQKLVFQNVDVTIRSPNNVALFGGSTVPTTLIIGNSAGFNLLMEGIDLSAYTGTIFGFGGTGGYACMKDCKIGASTTIGTIGSSVPAQIDIINVDSAGTNYRAEHHSQGGDLVNKGDVTRTGGFTSNGTLLSYRMVTSAQSSWILPFWGPPINMRNTVTAANCTLTIYGIAATASMPNNDDWWFDVEYLGASGSPLGSFASGTKSSILASNAALTADTSAWDTNVSARQNSHTYNVGDAFKTASNPGRVFFCTVNAGATAGSEPAGYASAVDGSTITDGGCTARAGYRFKLAVTISSPQPAQTGLWTIYPKMAKASSTIYYDPLPVQS
jgi:hypothetical protein